MLRIQPRCNARHSTYFFPLPFPRMLLEVVPPPTCPFLSPAAFRRPYFRRATFCATALTRCRFVFLSVPLGRVLRMTWMRGQIFRRSSTDPRLLRRLWHRSRPLINIIARLESHANDGLKKRATLIGANASHVDLVAPKRIADKKPRVQGQSSRGMGETCGRNASILNS